MAENNRVTKKDSKKSFKSLEKTMQTFSEDLHRSLNEAGNNLEGASEAFVQQQMWGIMNGVIPVPISFDNGDQSPLSGGEAQFLRNMWAGGMDFNMLHNPVNDYFSDWLKTIYSGDYEGFLKMIEGKSDRELKTMLSKRESLYNVSAIFHVVIGARIFGKGNKSQPCVLNDAKTLNVKNDHMKIFIKLLGLGVDVNVHDFAGFTPLHHCVSAMGNEVTFKMAERLLKAGAKVNAKNRFGETPLANVAMTTHYDAVELLLKHGGDPYIRDNDGAFPNNTHSWNPKLRKMFGEYYKKNIKAQISHPDYESQSKCNLCGKKSQTNQKCTGCYLTWYCSPNCQKEDWTSHKIKCKELKSQYKIGTYKPQYIATFSGMSKAITTDPPKENKKLVKTHFVVKVQVPVSLKDSSIHTEGNLGIYNKDKSFNISMPKENNEELHSRLNSKISSEGFRGLKGYFHVILEAGDKEANQFRINPEHVFVEPW